MLTKVLFDFDGVLYDSTRVGMQKMLQAAQGLELSGLTTEILSNRWGEHLEELSKYWEKECRWPKGVAEIFFAEVCRIDQEFKIDFFPEAEEVLLTLIKQDYQLGIISNRTQDSLIRILKQNPFLNNFFKLITNSGAKYLKPDRRAINPFLNLGWKLGEICFVGDTLKYDYQFVKNLQNQISFIGRTSILHSRDNFLQEKIPSECIIDSLVEIFSALKFLNQQEVA